MKGPSAVVAVSELHFALCLEDGIQLLELSVLAPPAPHRQVVVAMTGDSKAEAVRFALQSTDGPANALPGRLVRPVVGGGGSAIWLMDAPAAAKLDVAAGARAILAADTAARHMAAQ